MTANPLLDPFTPPPVPPDVQQRQVADRDRAVKAAIFAADHAVLKPGVSALPGADRTRIAVTAAIGHLIGHGLITVTPEAEWPEWLPVDPLPHLAPDTGAVVARWAQFRQEQQR